MNKLSAKEMHIYVTQGLQRQGAYKKDKQYPAAIDIALNKAEERIIKSRLFTNTINPNRFEIDQKYVSDIQSLIVLGKELNVETNSTKSYGQLPYDFTYLLGSNSYSVQDCIKDYPNKTSNITERIIVLPFSSAKTASPYYQTTEISVNTQIKTLSFAKGYQTLFEKTYLVDSIIDLFKSLDQTVYWERYKNNYIQDSFLLVTRDLNLTVGISIDNLSVTTRNIDSTIKIYSTPLLDGIFANNREIKADYLNNLLQSNYHKPFPDSPISIISNNEIQVYTSKRFLVNRIILNYIRKPRAINLDLNHGSELAPSTHTETCDLAIQILKKQIEDETYVQEVQDNKNRVEI